VIEQHPLWVCDRARGTPAIAVLRGATSYSHAALPTAARSTMAVSRQLNGADGSSTAATWRLQIYPTLEEGARSARDLDMVGQLVAQAGICASVDEFYTQLMVGTPNHAARSAFPERRAQSKRVGDRRGPYAAQFRTSLGNITENAWALEMPIDVVDRRRHAPSLMRRQLSGLTPSRDRRCGGGRAGSFVNCAPQSPPRANTEESPHLRSSAFDQAPQERLTRRFIATPLGRWRKERAYIRYFSIQNFASARETAITKPIKPASQLFAKAFALPFRTRRTSFLAFRLGWNTRANQRRPFWRPLAAGTTRSLTKTNRQASKFACLPPKKE
jgi:hypothetical protein